ncbi:MAG: hypothetical protein HYS18_17710 [Burkholderiales bacterium]|nr:hypothetical protein [Burkholderiales bacterium]
MKTITTPLRLVLLMIATMIFTSSAAFAHGGEDHGGEAPAAQSGQQIAPRAEAKSDELEMLAIADGKALTIYLTQYKTNAPVENAQIEIESGQNKTIAKPASGGVYQADAPWLAQAGKHKLVVTVQGKDVADLLEGTLDVRDTQKELKAERIGRFAPTGVIGSLGGVALIGMALYGLRRRKKSTGEK